MEQLRMGIHLRGYAQKDPFQEFKRESFALFTNMLNEMKRFSIARLLTFDLAALTAPAPIGVSGGGQVAVTPAQGIVSRNSACPCGSGKKYKHCCGAIQTS